MDPNIGDTKSPQTRSPKMYSNPENFTNVEPLEIRNHPFERGDIIRVQTSICGSPILFSR